ncbi:hypothetical protein DN068_06795 [Taibaiella soli]|uniref:Uncharacterized protein n=2 Tax=Taibaiella soli TaxID=1649169 RepID=A0A2W2B125_9BACT|nr:hypothetical protein DN068_06795 [Taibaiella soli]
MKPQTLILAIFLILFQSSCSKEKTQCSAADIMRPFIFRVSDSNGADLLNPMTKNYIGVPAVSMVDQDTSWDIIVDSVSGRYFARTSIPIIIPDNYLLKSSRIVISFANRVGNDTARISYQPAGRCNMHVMDTIFFDSRAYRQDKDGIYNFNR